MIWLFGVLAALTTFVIAAVAVGAATGRQASRVRRAVYDVDDAVDYVADHLSTDVAADVSYDDVRAVLDMQLDYLRAKGLATYRTDDLAAADLIVVSEDEPLAQIIGRVGDLAEREPASALTDEQVAEILEAEEQYRRAIGGYGPEVSAQ